MRFQIGTSKVGCVLAPFKVDYATWTNNPGASTVTVDIYFYVECVRKSEEGLIGLLNPGKTGDCFPGFLFRG